MRKFSNKNNAKPNNRTPIDKLVTSLVSLNRKTKYIPNIMDAILTTM